jgi:hypothetical protein
MRDVWDALAYNTQIASVDAAHLSDTCRGAQHWNQWQRH